MADETEKTTTGSVLKELFREALSSEKIKERWKSAPSWQKITLAPLAARTVSDTFKSGPGQHVFYKWLFEPGIRQLRHLSPYAEVISDIGTGKRYVASKMPKGVKHKIEGKLNQAYDARPDILPEAVREKLDRQFYLPQPEGYRFIQRPFTGEQITWTAATTALLLASTGPGKKLTLKTVPKKYRPLFRAGGKLNPVLIKPKATRVKLKRYKPLPADAPRSARVKRRALETYQKVFGELPAESKAGRAYQKVISAGPALRSASAKSMLLGAPYIVDDIFLRKRPPAEKTQLITDAAVAAGERAINRKKLSEKVQTANYKFNPVPAAVIGGLVGGTAGYMVPKKYKLLSALGGSMAGAALPFALAAVMKMHKQASEKAPEPPEEESVAEPETPEDVTPEKPAAEKKKTPSVVSATARNLTGEAAASWFDRNKYSLGAGAAAGLGTALGIGGIFADRKWPWLAGSAGSFGLSYYLARRAQKHRPGVPSVLRFRDETFRPDHPRLPEVNTVMISVFGENAPPRQDLNRIIWRLEEAKEKGGAAYSQLLRQEASKLIEIQRQMGTSVIAPDDEKEAEELLALGLKAASEGLDLEEAGPLYQRIRAFAEKHTLESMESDMEAGGAKENTKAVTQYRQIRDQLKQENPEWSPRQLTIETKKIMDAGGMIR